MFVNVKSREIKKMDLIPRHPGDEIWPDGAEPRERERRSESVFDLERLLGARCKDDPRNMELGALAGRRQAPGSSEPVSQTKKAWPPS